MRVLIALLIIPFMTILGNYCQGVQLDEQASALFQKTQEASVFYLDNGMEVILIENHSSPMITAFTIVKAGNRNENAATNGTAHFLEHLLFNGTETRAQKQIYEEMDFYGGYNNAHTGPDYTNYMILMPKEYIAQGMDIQADMLFNSVLPEDKFEKERGIVLEEIGKSANRPSYHVDNHFRKVFFSGTPYERPVLGTISTISHLKRKDVFEYYKTWYVPNNMILMVIGDFKTPEMIELVKEKYGKAPPGALPERSTIQLHTLENLRIVRANGTGKFPEDRRYITMGYVLPSPTHEDFHTLRMLAEFLGGKDNSILDTLFKKEEYSGLLHSISAHMDFNRDFSTLQISAEIPCDSDEERVVNLVINNAVNNMAEKTVPSDDLQSSLTSHAIHEIYLQEKLHYYAMMKSGYLVAGGYSFFREYMDHLMSVTPESIRNAAETYLKDQIPVVTVMSPLLREDEAKKATSQSLYHEETLNNGMKIVLKENHDSRVIGVHVLAKGRCLAEGLKKRGLAEILQRMMLNGGTVMHPNDELRHEFETIGAEIKLYDNPHIPYDDYYHSPRFSYIRLKLVDVYFDKGMKLLAGLIKQPELAEDTFKQAQKTVISLAKDAALSTPAIAKKLFYDNLFSMNPGFGNITGSAVQLGRIQLGNVRSFHQKMYNPSNLTLVIVGNISIDNTMKTVKRYFDGEWGTAGWEPPGFKPEFAPFSGKTIREKAGKMQSYIIVGNTYNIDEKKKPALAVLQYLFSEKLAFRLREEQGLAYTIGISFPRYENAWWYRITMGTRPENIDKAIKGIRNEIHNIRKRNFEPEEIQKAIHAILGRRGMRRLDRINQAFYISMEIMEIHWKQTTNLQKN